MNLDAIVQAAMRGEARAEAKLALNLTALLRRFFANYMDESDACDAAQDTVITILRKLHTFEVRDGQPIGRWALGFARNHLRNLHRNHSRRAKLDHALTEIERPPPTGPSEQLYRMQCVKVLHEELEQLDESPRRAIENILAERPAAELAELQGIKVSYAWVLRSRAIHELGGRVRGRVKTPLPKLTRPTPTPRVPPTPRPASSSSPA